ncbi:MAG: N-acetylneuraminate synthase [Candidatus Thermoplasmatota archaeon]
MVNMHRIHILDKKIGKNHPCFVIAEAGVNHNGKLNLAKKLVDVAVDAGADAVKFQTFRSEGVVTDKADTASYVKKNIGKNIKQIEMIKNLELKYDEFRELKNYCDNKNIIFLSTPHSFDAIDFLDDLVPAFKFGSSDLTNIPTIKHAAKKGKPIILGTGMATLQEVKDAISSIKKTGNDNIIVLHCTTNYPCPFEEVNMNAMITMQKKLDCLVGYSDHTMGISVPVMAATLGAVVIEKHFTIDRNLSGPDHNASLEPTELKNMVTEIRNVEKALGRSEKKPTDSEKEIMNVARKSIVAKKDIKKGEIIRRKLLCIKRPGIGLHPKEINNILGKKTRKDIKKDELILKKDIE